MADTDGLLGAVFTCCGVASILLSVAFIVLLGFVFSTRSKRAFRNALKSTALETGCSYDASGCFRSPKVSGMFRNRNILIDSYTEHHGGDDDRSTTYTRIQANHSGRLPGEINVYPATLFSAIGKKLGMQDMQVGNPEFDKTFIVKGGDEGMVRGILDMDVQQKLIRLKPAVHVYTDKVYTRTAGYIKDKKLLMELVNLMADLAERAERAR
jgi:hypothetical protein